MKKFCLPRNILILFTVLGFSTFYPLTVDSQYYTSGQDPASVKWHQIKTVNFQIIYPESFKEKSQYLANLLEYVYLHCSKTLNHQPKKISVIIHNETVISNAFVAWAPKRMELYTCPPQDNYAQGWLEQLAIHEYRHVVQTDKFNQGITKILTLIFGQHIPVAVMGMYVPFWFLEGDAVATETALSNSGRGRVPSFEMPLRTQILEKGKYSYDKAVFGSYKDFVSDHYILGYQLVAHSRKKYGPKLWEKTLNIVAKQPYMVIPFSKGVKKTTLLSKTKLYDQILNELDSLWTIQNRKLSFTKYNLISVEKAKFHTDYNFASYINNIITACKTGMDDIPRFVYFDSIGNEQVIFKPGRFRRESLSAEQNLITWAETKQDPRWDNRTYSVIKTYNINTNKTNRLSKKSRYFAPSLSYDAKKIVAVEINAKNENSLIIMNSGNGSVIKRINRSDSIFFMTPSWSDINNIICIVQNSNGKSIAVINPETSEIEFVIPFTFTEISKPKMFGNYIIFTGAYTGIENIFAFNTNTKEMFLVTSSRFGATDPNISEDGKKIIYSDYTAYGYRIVETEFNPALWISIKDIKNSSVKLYEEISKQENFVLDSKNVPEKKYDSKRYRKWLNLFNFHSWAPVSIDADNYDIKPGVSFMSQNKLSSSYTSFGYEYDINNAEGKYYFDYSYQGLYPIIDARIEYGKREGVYISPKNERIDFNYEETNYKIGVRLPLDLTRGKYYKGIQPKIQFTQVNLEMEGSSPVKFKNNLIQIIEYRFYAYNQLKRSTKDLYPKWGQNIDLFYRNNPFTGKPGSITALTSNLYFPGLIKHHGFKIYGGIQIKDNGEYNFSNIINNPRGYINIEDDTMFTVANNYKFPVFYPDLKILSLLYIKRIKANIFYDYCEGMLNNTKSFYVSTGFELTADFHALRFIAPIEFGIRSIYKPNEASFSLEYLLSINFGAL